MPITTVSRWTMSYFAASLAAFLLAQAMMAIGWSYPKLSAQAPATLIAVHLTTIGWLSTLILGALCQFVPVITTKPLTSDRLTLVSLIMIHTGLGLMLAGFAALGGYIVASTDLLPVGGIVVLSGFATSAANLGLALWRARPLPLGARFIAAGLCFLLVTGMVGVVLVLGVATSAIPDSLLPVFRSALLLHLVAGLGGWFTLTAMGVSYRLLSMFMLAPEKEDGISSLALAASLLGLIVWWCATLAEDYAAPVSRFTVGLGELLALIGLLLYTIDIAQMFGARKRRRLELNSIAAAVAIFNLVAGLIVFAALTEMGRVDEFAGPLIYLLVFGWLSGLGLSQLYKIVPFLTWLQRFGPLLGKAPVPRVQDLVDERRAAPWFILYFAAVLTGAACGFLGFTGPWRAAIAVHLSATVFIVVELWRAQHPRLARPAVETKPGAAHPRSYAKGET